jgi:gas vesicle protein
MDYKEAIRAGLQELILPELNRIKDEIAHVKSVQELTNKRLDDTNAHILDQSRRIDDLRTELTGQIQGVHDQLKQEIQNLRTELTGQIQKFHDQLKQEIQDLRSELKEDIRGLTHRLDTTNDRLDRMTMAMVRREEQERLFEKVSGLEMRVFRVEERIAA